MNKDSGALFKMLQVYLFIVLLLSACSLPEIKKQSEIVSSLGEVSGQVDVLVKKNGPVYVVLFEKKNGYFDLIDYDFVGEDGAYKLNVIPGTYSVAAYVDANNDEEYQPDEPASYLGILDKTPKEFRVNAGEKVAIEPIRIDGAIKHRATEGYTVSSPNYLNNIGRVVSLDDPMFQRENASMGLWKPIDFIDTIGGGLFLLQEFDDKKVPVLFIHGINGTPIEWEDVIASMDKEKFQAWVLYYPSGVRLDMLSDYLIQSVNTLQKRLKVTELNIVAHSMGGLLMRSYVMKKTNSESQVKIALSVTVNSPMAGMRSAKNGVKHSPIVVPSWRDVAEDSEFVQKITAWTWPVDIPYYLIFSYESGEGSDGVVPLESQIPFKLQDEAVRMYGFNSSHAGVLKDEKFILKLNDILEESLN